jgi:hypothetical protein
MDPEGRLTVPEAARAALHVEGATQFELEVNGDVLILHPLLVPEEDSWAYTPDHLARVDRARQQGRAGVTHTLTEPELERRATG